MIRIGTQREPVTVTLRPPYGDVTVTLQRLTSADYGEARQAAQAITRDSSALLELLVKHDLLPEGGVTAWKRMKDKDAMRYATFISGIGMWLGAVECAVRGIKSWTGIVGDGGKPAPVDRETIEVLMLDEALSNQITGEIDRTARILFIEGEPSGA